MKEQTFDTRLGIGWYTPESYAALLEVADDRADLPGTFEAWLQHARKLLFGLRVRGLDPEQVFIDVPELVHWSRSRVRPVNAKSRADFAREKVTTLPPSRPLQF